MHTKTLRKPDASYLLGALLADGVPTVLAKAIAKQYEELEPTLTSQELATWKESILTKLNQRQGIAAETFICLHSYPSESQHGRYSRLVEHALHSTEE